MYPPCLSQICYLDDLGVKVIVGFGGCDESVKKILENRNIKYFDWKITRKKRGYLEKIFSYYNYAKAAKNMIKKVCSKDDILWFGTADSAFALTRTLKDKKYAYVLSILELYDNNKLYKKEIGEIIHDAKVVISCEYTRALIMKSWWNLKKIPYVMPNKPYFHPKKKQLEGTIPLTKQMICRIKDKKFILYQGIIAIDRDLKTLAMALSEMKQDIFLVLMGKEINGSAKQIEDIYDKTIYLGYAPAPFHLEVTSYAMIGIANYDDSSLNNLFCAPNKIYEYSGFGIPVIGSNVPGLINTIQKYNAGICVDFMNVFKIREAIERLMLNYEQYSTNAYNFFDTVDNMKVIKEIITEIKG